MSIFGLDASRSFGRGSNFLRMARFKVLTPKENNRGAQSLHHPLNVFTTLALESSALAQNAPNMPPRTSSICSIERRLNPEVLSSVQE